MTDTQELRSTLVNFRPHDSVPRDGYMWAPIIAMAYSQSEQRVLLAVHSYGNEETKKREYDIYYNTLGKVRTLNDIFKNHYNLFTKRVDGATNFYEPMNFDVIWVGFTLRSIDYNREITVDKIKDKDLQNQLEHVYKREINQFQADLKNKNSLIDDNILKLSKEITGVNVYSVDISNNSIKLFFDNKHWQDFEIHLVDLLLNKNWSSSPTLESEFKNIEFEFSTASSSFKVNNEHISYQNKVIAMGKMLEAIVNKDKRIEQMFNLFKEKLINANAFRDFTFEHNGILYKKTYDGFDSKFEIVEQ